MPKVKRKLTETEIKNAQPKEKPYKLYDEGELLLLVRPSGTKVWQYPYKYNDKYNLYTIGQHGTVGSAEARRQRDQVKALLKQGINPNQQKKEAIKQTQVEHLNSFETLAREWYNKQIWAPKHAKNIMSRLEKDVFSEIGTKPITAINVRDIIEVLKKIEERGALDVARRINQYCTAIFDYAITIGLCDNNPALGRSKFIKTYETKHRDHLAEHELPDFLRTLDKANQLSISALAAHLLVLTALRPSELRFARWGGDK